MTLIELLITMTILAVISTAIYASLNSGLKIWKRINQQLVHEDLDIFFHDFDNPSEINTRTNYFVIDEEAGIELSGTCIKIKGKDYEIVKAVNRLLYQWYGIMD